MKLAQRNFLIEIEPVYMEGFKQKHYKPYPGLLLWDGYMLTGIKHFICSVEETISPCLQVADQSTKPVPKSAKSLKQDL